MAYHANQSPASAPAPRLKRDIVLDWLMHGDPAIRWQVMQDLSRSHKPLVREAREQIAHHGWGKSLLALQSPDGLWGGGLYSPKWTSTTYSLLLLRRMGLPAPHPQANTACGLLLDKGCYHDGGINFSATIQHSETCITGMVLSIVSYFQYRDPRVEQLVTHLLRQQMKDGGWNCLSYQGDTHSSVHTTINVLEGLQEYQRSCKDYRGDNRGGNRSDNSYKHCSEVTEAQIKGREFLLAHRLFRSHRSGNIFDPKITRLSFPPRWRYDIMRALDYFQASGAPYDKRMNDALQIIVKKQTADGRWLLQQRYPGKTFFEMEKVGEPSRWNTLRALRILRKYPALL
jgi:hypothetical protein